MTDTRTIALTGATSGLGRLAAVDLARRGFRLALTARSDQKGAETRLEIQEAVPGAQVDIFLGDLSRIYDVRRIGESIGERYGRLDALINNAGLHAFAPRFTSDGYPEMVAVNYLAPFVLTDTLLPALRAAPSARIVNVASEASRKHGTLRLPGDLTDATEFSARGSSPIYGKTKLMNIMFTMELARRLADSKITVNCLDPGFNVTGLGRELRFAGALERALKTLRIGDPARGADLIVALATAPEYAQKTAAYVTLRGRKEITPATPGNDRSMQRKLWDDTVTLLASRRGH
ncbi:SDR family NAD(P)-dependent oxidoreductase [Microbacterium sp. cx-55]|uniref:SDR family NAD(P)-dependent oxidoreductase n=1 Tax=Microbacterium sp. cx-55 TaxID=2875948 RepID=UPI001CBA88B1|nr:SDR family NAD(P)-dependent oxidoreductase [Microbacterium sp. cx-55]MBZ4487883.1 SDR family NAD(P)-dependent oxidoreductase [Microbacterium sp. cx-55]UGB34706.1 SDR family NAD(P)-dependent oxidoreductase [Microbacterium sp. cx-55]